MMPTALVRTNRVVRTAAFAYCIVPIGLYLCGASDIWTFDISPLLEAGRLRQLLQMFRDYSLSGALRKFLPHALPQLLQLAQCGAMLILPCGPEVVAQFRVLPLVEGDDLTHTVAITIRFDEHRMRREGEPPVHAQHHVVRDLSRRQQVFAQQSRRHVQ